MGTCVVHFLLLKKQIFWIVSWNFDSPLTIKTKEKYPAGKRPWYES